MSHMEDQMRQFEASMRPGSSRPAFMPSSVRGQVPPPPSAARGAPDSSGQFSSPAVISRPPATVDNDDEDVFSTLLKYEKEVRAEKREQKHFEKKKRELGLCGVPVKPVASQAAPPVNLLEVPRDINQLSAGAQMLAEKYKVAEKPLLDEPDLEDTRKGQKKPKTGTEVTPVEISAKARQMVELVKASQVMLVEKRLAGNPHAAGGMQNAVVSDKEAAIRKGKKTKKMIRVAGGQVWEDTSLLNWDSNDYRLFAGDLGNDVTDEVLTRTFSKFPSFQMAKVG
jgi:hypothetical protein